MLGNSNTNIDVWWVKVEYNNKYNKYNQLAQLVRGNDD